MTKAEVGTFRARMPRVGVVLPGMEEDEPVEFIVDTAFDGGLKVPARIARNLAAEPADAELHMLADESLVMAPIYRAMVWWLGGEREVEITVAEGNLLLGIALLEGCRLTVEAEEGGEVVIELVD